MVISDIMTFYSQWLSCSHLILLFVLGKAQKSKLKQKLTMTVTPEPNTSITDTNAKNYHGSLTTVVRAQNDTPKTANITCTIFDRTLV